MTRSILLAGLLLSVLFFPGGLFAHAGHDHGSTEITTTGSQWPRFEAQTDSLELVGVLRDDGLALYLDEFASNAPIIGAAVEVELEDRVWLSEETAPGLYQLDDTVLHQPGRHPLVVIVSAPGLDDLLVATLEVPEVAAIEQAGYDYLPWLIGGGLLALALLGVWRLGRVTASHSALLLLLAAGFWLNPQTGHTHAGHDHGAADQAMPRNADQAQRLPDGSLFIPKTSQRLLSIRTVMATPQSVARPISLMGHVVPDPNASGRVQAGRAGRISPGPNGLPHLGQAVRKGDTLAWLLPVAETLELGSGEAQLADLEGRITLGEQQLARLQRLSGSVAQQEIEAAEVELQSLKRRRVALAAGLYQREPLLAPADGVITLAAISAGEVVEARQTLFEVVDPQRLWVEAVSWDAALSRQIETARVVLPDGGVLSARLIGAGARLRQQAIPLLFALQGPLPPLPIETKVNVLADSNEVLDGVVIPRSSITRGSDGIEVVWLHRRAEHFSPQRVVFLPLDGDRVVVTEGLEPGDRVVSNGAALLPQIR